MAQDQVMGQDPDQVMDPGQGDMALDQVVPDPVQEDLVDLLLLLSSIKIRGHHRHHRSHCASSHSFSPQRGEGRDEG